MGKSLFFLCFLFCFGRIYAQVEKVADTISESEKTEMLGEIILSNNILGSKFEVKNRTGSAYYISPKELQQFGYLDINKIILAVPGVTIVEEEGFGLRPNISIRGTSPERSSKITLMEDGVLIAPAPYSAPAAYYFPTVGRIDAIEVLKGSSQVQYGPYTTGGAMNLVSKQVPTDFSGDIRFYAGNYDSRNTEATVGDAGENLGFVAQYFNYNTDGFKDLDGGGNTGFDKNDYLGKVRFNTDWDARIFQSLTAKVQYSEENGNETYLGLTDEDFKKDPYRRYRASSEDNIVTEHRQFQLDHLIKPMENISVRTTAYQNEFARNWYKIDDVTLTKKVSISDVLEDPVKYQNEYQALLGNNDTAADVFGIKANNRTYDSRGIQSVANYRFGKTVFSDIEVGLRYHEDEEDRFQWTDRYGFENSELIRTTVATKGTESNRINSAKALAAHILYKLAIDNLTITPGLRYEDMTFERLDYGKSDPDRTGSNLKISENKVDVFIPGIGANYIFSNELTLFGGIHKGFAPPGSTEGTDPESSINYELGSRFNYKGLTGEFVVYYNDYDNLLGSDLAASGGEGSLDQFNAGESVVKGVELILNYNLLRGTQSKLKLPLTFSYTLTDAKFQSDFISEVEIFGEVNKGDQIPYIPQNQLNLTAALENTVYQVSLSARFTDEFRTQAGTGSIPEEYRIGSSFIMDFAARYFYTPRITFFANIMNILDTEYEVARTPSGLRPGSPLLFNAGIGFSF